jgi:hypothetical protein
MRIAVFLLVLSAAAVPVHAQEAPPPPPAADTAAEDPPVHRFMYARLGYGAIAGDRSYGTSSMGFGYRFESESLGLDVAFLNFQTGGTGYDSANATAWSLLKLQGLYFLSPATTARGYVGGGLSWGGIGFGSGEHDYGALSYSTSWNGSGLQGEMTVGYELPRANALRVFVEANAVLPLYKVGSQTYTHSRGGASTTTAQSRYAPSLIASVGVGWRRGRH